MHSSRLGEDEPMAEMNFIPLIDIALTLVIILMVTTAFVKQPGVSLKLPETATREGKPETPKDMVVAVGQDGALWVDGQRQETSVVKARLAALAARDPQSRVLVKGHRDVPYRNVMEVIDLARQAGLTRVVLPTDPKTAQ